MSVYCNPENVEISTSLTLNLSKLMNVVLVSRIFIILFINFGLFRLTQLTSKCRTRNLAFVGRVENPEGRFFGEERTIAEESFIDSDDKS